MELFVLDKKVKLFNCVQKKMSPDSYNNVIYKMSLKIIYLIHMYKKDLALNYLQCLICHKIKLKPNQKFGW